MHRNLGLGGERRPTQSSQNLVTGHRRKSDFCAAQNEMRCRQHRIRLKLHEDVVQHVSNLEKGFPCSLHTEYWAVVNATFQMRVAGESPIHT